MTESLADFDTVPYRDGDIICFLDFSSVDLWHKTQFKLSFFKERITEPIPKKIKSRLDVPRWVHMGLDETLVILVILRSFNNKFSI